MPMSNQLLLLAEQGIDDLKKSGFNQFEIGDVSERTLFNLSSKLTELQARITLDDITFTGLSDIAVLFPPEFDYNKKFLRLGLRLEDVYIHTGNSKISSTIRFFSFSRTREFQPPKKIHIKHLELVLTLEYDIDFSEKRFLLFPEMSCDFTKITAEGSPQLLSKTVLTLLKETIKKKVAAKSSQYLSAILAQKIEELTEKETKAVSKFSIAHQLRKKESDYSEKKIPRLLQGFEDIGQFPLPTLWKIPKVDIASCHATTIEELKKDVRTGDLLLFSGTAPSSMRIKQSTQSPFSHVIIAVNDPELVEGRSLGWQATASFHNGVLRNMKNDCGIQLNYIEDIMNDYWAECPDATIVHRRLMDNGTRAIISKFAQQRLRDYILKMDGKPYTDDMEGLYIMGLFEVQSIGHPNYLCAGTVAESLMKLNILDDKFMQHQYCPRDFSNLQINLPLMGNYSYHQTDLVFTNPNL